MPLFVLTCLDKPDSLPLRMEIRPHHLAYLEQFTSAVKLAGPLLDDVEGAPNGSMLVIEFPTMEDAKAFGANDPYAKAGLFQHTRLTPFRATIGSI
jgi:uncharacterized protein